VSHGSRGLCIHSGSIRCTLGCTFDTIASGSSINEIHLEFDTPWYDAYLQPSDMQLPELRPNQKATSLWDQKELGVGVGVEATLGGHRLVDGVDASCCTRAAPCDSPQSIDEVHSLVRYWDGRPTIRDHECLAQFEPFVHQLLR